PAEVQGLSGREISPDAVRDGVRALDQVARSQGLTAAILRAAAGRVAGVKPSLSDSPETTMRRAETVKAGLSNVVPGRAWCASGTLGRRRTCGPWSICVGKRQTVPDRGPRRKLEGSAA